MKINNKQIRFITLAIIWIIWLIITFYFLTQPADESSKASGFITGIFLRLFPALRENPADLEFIIRKIAHFGSYAVSGLLGYFTLSLTALPNILIVHLPLHAVLSILSELLQMLSEGRYCSIVDMGIDFSGACLGLAFAALVSYLFNRRKGAHST